jgi:hypothetical protein
MANLLGLFVGYAEYEVGCALRLRRSYHNKAFVVSQLLK